MSSSSLSLTEQRALVLGFIKKHKAHLLFDDDDTNSKVTDKFIARLEKAKGADFDELATSIMVDKGSEFYPFNSDVSGKTRKIKIWSGNTAPVNLDEWENASCWSNMTPLRFSFVDNLFTNLFAKKTTAKKPTAKKAAPKKKTDVVVIDDDVKLKKEVAFIDFDADKFEHFLHQGGRNIDCCYGSLDSCGKDNQIDHVINAFKLALKEGAEFVKTLEKAKTLGAKFVIDSSWEDMDSFDF